MRQPRSLGTLRTYEEDEAGALVELHGVGICQLQHGLGVPGELAALDVVQHLHPALPCDHLPLGVQHDEGWDACDGKKLGRIRQNANQPAAEKPFPIAPALAGAQGAAASPQLARVHNWGPGILFPSSQSAGIQALAQPVPARAQADVTAIGR